MTGSELAVPTAELLVLAQKQGWLDSVRYALRAKHKILVLGSTGVGKSNFIKSLTQLSAEAIPALNRTEFAERHKLRIEHQPFVFIDAPGQEHHAARRLDLMKEALAHGVSGIINVASYGYHEYKTSKSNAVLPNGTVNPEFLIAHRDAEIRAMGEWNRLLADRKNCDWLLTIASKADLWWDQQEAVIAYYEKGGYAQALGDAQALRPSVLPYCSVVHRFFNDVPVSGFFDDGDRTRVRAHLLRQIVASVVKP